MPICPTCQGTGQITLPVTREGRIKFIQSMLGKHSYQHIADLLKIHKSTVGYTVKKYDLKPLVTSDMIENPDTVDTLAQAGPGI